MCVVTRTDIMRERVSEAGSLSLSLTVSIYASVLGPSCHYSFCSRGEWRQTIICALAAGGGKIEAGEVQGTVQGP